MEESGGGATVEPGPGRQLTAERSREKQDDDAATDEKGKVRAFMAWPDGLSPARTMALVNALPVAYILILVCQGRKKTGYDNTRQVLGIAGCSDTPFHIKPSSPSRY